MEYEDKNVGVLLDRIESLACNRCATEIDISESEPFSEIACPSCQSPLLIPARLGHFLLCQLIGKGGMGGIYYAKDETLDRYVAVKVMLKSLGEDAEFVQSFKREAQAAAQLNHPHIAQIYSFGQEKGQPYIVMELVAGQKFANMIEAGEPLDETLVIKVGLEVAEGLQAASEVGLVHGDIKPENILLDEKMQAKLVDFGLASYANQQAAEGIWGTPYYIAPEKIRRLPTDLRSDIYSLGATLFHALAGRPPFEGETPVEVVKARLEQPAPELRTVRPDASEDVERIVARMLQMDPGMRYPTYASLIGDLRRVYKSLAAKQGFAPTGRVKPRKMLIKKSTGRIRLDRRDGQDADAHDKLEEIRKRSMGQTPPRKGNAGKVFLVIGLTLLALVLASAGVTGWILYDKKRQQTWAARAARLELQAKVAAADEAYGDVEKTVARIAAVPPKVQGLAEQATNVVFLVLAERLDPDPSAKPVLQEVKPDLGPVAGGAATNRPAASEPVPPGADDGAVPAGVGMSRAQLERRRALEQQRAAADAERKKAEEEAERRKAEEKAAAEAVAAAAAAAPPDDRPLMVQARAVIQCVNDVRSAAARAREVQPAAAEARDAARSAVLATNAQEFVVRIREMAGELTNVLQKAEGSAKKAQETVADMTKAMRVTLKEREADARRRSEAAARQREEAARQAKIQQEVDAVKAAETQAAQHLLTYEFATAVQGINRAAEGMMTDQGRGAMALLLARYTKLRDLKAFVVQSLNADPFRWGWGQGAARKDIVGADESFMKIQGAQIPWGQVPPGHFLRIVEHYLGKPDVKSRTAGDQYLAVAIFYLLNGKADNAKDYKARALRNAPYLQDEADRLLPADL